ncbi:MAG: hypothetical protein HGA31_06865 [Candidatus Moranbacteria bacterium]|nr:hypothetical protein [Candidatus Moranbacteria bacterium]
MKENPMSVPSDAESQAKNVPQFIREFSRSDSKEERDVLAASIRESRRKRDEWQAEHDGRSVERERLAAELDGLRNEIAAYENGGLVTKVKDFLAYRSVKAELKEKLGVLDKSDDAIADAEEIKPDFEETRRLLDAFYTDEKEKWEKAGYTPEDIAKQFTEERLSSLSVEDYALLMRRFPGEMLTHVTRQGIRDHAGTIWHTAGEGKYHKGFESMLEDGRLRSSLGIALKERSKEEAVSRFLRLDKVNSREDALTMLAKKFESNVITDNGFADTSAVHFAAETVMDEMYGSEKGNEIFVAFPAAYVASQLRFGGHGRLTEGHGGVWNDKWVYTKDHEGMPLDAGIVFIPEDAMVSSKTGSRYEIGDEGEPSVRTRHIDEILDARFGKNGFIQKFVQDLSPRLAKLPLQERLSLAQGAFKEFGITDADAQKALVDLDVLEKFADAWGSDGERDEYGKILGKYYGKCGADRYEVAKEPISSKEYWEQYFQQHPERRLSKVVYYRGGDPSHALNRWREGAGIRKDSDDWNLGFSDHYVGENAPEANEGKERLLSLAHKLIDERFPATEMATEEA